MFQAQRHPPVKEALHMLQICMQADIYGHKMTDVIYCVTSKLQTG